MIDRDRLKAIADSRGVAAQNSAPAWQRPLVAPRDLADYRSFARHAAPGRKYRACWTSTQHSRDRYPTSTTGISAPFSSIIARRISRNEWPGMLPNGFSRPRPAPVSSPGLSVIGWAHGRASRRPTGACRCSRWRGRVSVEKGVDALAAAFCSALGAAKRPLRLQSIAFDAG